MNKQQIELVMGEVSAAIRDAHLRVGKQASSVIKEAMSNRLRSMCAGVTAYDVLRLEFSGGHRESIYANPELHRSKKFERIDAAVQKEMARLRAPFERLTKGIEERVAKLRFDLVFVDDSKQAKQMTNKMLEEIRAIGAQAEKLAAAWRG